MNYNALTFCMVACAVSLAAAANAQMMGCYYSSCSESQRQLQERLNYGQLQYEQDKLRHQQQQQRTWEMEY